MEIGTLFTEQKWNILKALSHEQLSPLQLSEKLDSTMANMSQQLKLLEAANLVSKEKIRNRDKGKPRSLFSLTDDYVYMIPAMKQFAGRKLMNPSKHQKVMLKIWFLQNEDLHYELSKLYWKIENKLSDIASIAVDEKSGTVYIASDKNILSQNISFSTIKPKVVSKSHFNKMDKQSLSVIF